MDVETYIEDEKAKNPTGFGDRLKEACESASEALRGLGTALEKLQATASDKDFIKTQRRLEKQRNFIKALLFPNNKNRRPNHRWRRK